MGAALVKRLISYAARVPLRGNEFRVLTAMSVTALDGDTPPRYFDSREALAASLGRMPPDAVPKTDARFASVERDRATAFWPVSQALKGLVSLEAIRRDVAGRSGHRAEYSLLLDVDRSVRTHEFRKRADVRKPHPET